VRRLVLTLTATLAVALAACGGSDVAAPTARESPTTEGVTHSATTTEATKKKHSSRSGAGGWSTATVPGYDTSKADVYKLARDLCDVAGVKAVARDYHTARDPVSAAEGYANGYQAPFQQPAYGGCMAGFGF
jgi:hypothetical protein